MEAVGLASRALCRSLVRTSRALDAGSFRCLLSLHQLQLPAPPPASSAPAPLAPAVVQLAPLLVAAPDCAPDVPAAIASVAAALDECLAGARLFPPASPGESALPPSLASGIVRALRMSSSSPLVPSASALHALYVGATLLHHIQHASAGEAAAPQCAAAPPLSPAARASLRPLRPAAALRPGVLMLQHPGGVAPGRAALLVYDIAESAPGSAQAADSWAVRAYCLNRPFPASVATVTRRADLGRFGDLPLFHGGSDHTALSVLHRHADIAGAVRIGGAPAEGVAAEGGEGGTDGVAGAAEDGADLLLGGDIGAINERLAMGAPADDFRVFMGATTLPLAASREAARAPLAPLPGGASTGAAPPAGDAGLSLSLPDDDAWWLAEGPGVARLALLPPHFDTTGAYRDGHGLGASDRVAGYNHARFWHQNAAWAAALELLAAGIDAARRPAERDAWPALLRACAALHPAVCARVVAALPLEIDLPPPLRNLGLPGAGGGDSA